MAPSDVSGCAAPDQAAPLPAGVDPDRETVITGRVTAAATGEPVGGAYVRLLDAGGEFTAEVVSSPAGRFRFFAAPGTWTLRALSRQGTGGATVTVGRGTVEVAIALAA
jgi:hypothetical protein